MKLQQSPKFVISSRRRVALFGSDQRDGSFSKKILYSFRVLGVDGSYGAFRRGALARGGGCRFEQTMFLFLQRLHEANDRGDSLLHSRITDGRVFLILLLEIIAPERHPEAFVRSLHIAAIDVSIDLVERELPAVSPAKLRDVRRIRFGEVSSFSGAGCSVAGCAKSIEVMLSRGLALSGAVETGHHKTDHNGDEDRSEHFFYGWVHRILTPNLWRGPSSLYKSRQPASPSGCR